MMVEYLDYIKTNENMAKIQPVKTDRNIKIYILRKLKGEGYPTPSFSELIEEYNITQTRIQTIVKQTQGRMDKDGKLRVKVGKVYRELKKLYKKNA